MQYGIFNIVGTDQQVAEVRHALESLRLNLQPLVPHLQARGITHIDVAFFFDSSSNQGMNEVGDGYCRILLNANRQYIVWGGSAIHELMHIWAFFRFDMAEHTYLCQAYGSSALWVDPVYSRSVTEAWVQAAMQVYADTITPQPGLNYLPWDRQPTTAVKNAIKAIMGEPYAPGPPLPPPNPPPVPPTPTVPTPNPLPIDGPPPFPLPPYTLAKQLAWETLYFPWRVRLK